MAGKAKKAATTEEQVRQLWADVMTVSNPGEVAATTFHMLALVARGIDELRAEAKK